MHAQKCMCMNKVIYSIASYWKEQLGARTNISR